MPKIETNIRNFKQAWTRQLSVLPWTPVKQNLPDTRKAVIKYLESLPWTFFLSGTTRYELTPKSNRRLIERWYNGFLIEPCQANNFTPYYYAGIRTKGSKLFWVSEPFELKDGCHGHGLLYLPGYIPNESDFNRLIDHWQLVTGNKDRSRENWNALNLKLYDPKRKAGGYCAKYIMKDSADYDILTYQSLNTS